MANLPGVRFDVTGASGSTGLLGPKESWKAYVFPRGGHASADSTGSTITFDSSDIASRFAVNDWIQAGLLTANLRKVNAVGGNSISFGGAAMTVTENQRIFRIGTSQPTVSGGSATYIPLTTIRQRGDDAADTYTNSMVTTNSDGLVQFYTAPNMYDVLVQDGNQSNQGYIADLEVGTVEGVSISDWAFFGSTLTVHGNFGVTGTAVFGGTVTINATLNVKNVECVRYVNRYTTGGSGTVASPWVGWEGVFSGDSIHVHFPSGIYTPPSQTSDTGNALTLGNNNTVTGCGAHSRIIVGSTWTFGNLFFASNKSGIIIRDLYIEGPNNATTSSSNEGIQFEGVSLSLIENVEATKWRHGIALNQDTLGTTLTTQRVTVRGCYSHDNKSLGITLKYGPTVDCIVEGNRITACTGGISLTHDCHRNIIRNNRIYALTSGVGVKIGGIGTGGAGTTSDYNLVDGNDISNCTTGGVFTGDDAGLFSQMTGNRIINNHIHDCVTGGGIAFQRNRRGVIANNTVFNLSEAASDAINISGSSVGATVYAAEDNVCLGNIVFNCAGTAIHVNGTNAANSADRNVINGNIVRGATGTGITIEGEVGGTCIGNIVTGCSSLPIDFNNSTTNRNVEMYGNVLSGNSSGASGFRSRQTITAADTAILVKAAPLVTISGDTSYTLTAAPTIADGYEGQVITITNEDGVDTIFLQDQGTLASSNLRLTGTSITLGPRDSVSLRYSDTIGDWVQITPVASVI